MTARKYFVNEYILPACIVGTVNSDTNFIEPFISLNDLMYNVQKKVNETACSILNAPDDAEKARAEVKWETLYELLTELEKL